MPDMNSQNNLQDYQKALDAIQTHAFAIVDAQTLNISYANKWMATSMGKYSYVTLLHDMLTAQQIEEIRQAMTTEDVYQFETEARYEKRPLHLRITLSHLPDNRGKLLLEFSDLSDLKKIQYSLASYLSEIETHNSDLRTEIDRNEKLLLNIMPKTVYEEWKQYGVTVPIKRDASVLAMDFVGFSTMAVERDPVDVISEMNDIFAAFDRIADHFDCERIKTLGDSYIAVSGIPDLRVNHEDNVCRAAVGFKRYIEQRNKGGDHRWDMRIGIASGPVIGSIVGTHKYIYDVFGPPVNLATRMQSLSGLNEITSPIEFTGKLKQEYLTGPPRIENLKGIGKTEICTISER